MKVQETLKKRQREFLLKQYGTLSGDEVVAKKVTVQELTKIVYEMALMGLDINSIRRMLGMSVAEWREWVSMYPILQEKYIEGKERTDASVVSALLKRAQGFYAEEVQVMQTKQGQILKIPYRKYYPPDVQAIKYWLKNRTRGSQFVWTDDVNVVHSGSVQVRHEDQYDYSQLSDSELMQLKELLNKMKKGRKGVEEFEEVTLKTVPERIDMNE